MKNALLSASAWMSAAVLSAGLATGGAAAADLRGEIAKDYPRLSALYEHLHANPELSLAETATAARLAQEWREAGFEVTEGVGGTGIVGVMRNGEGPTVMLRTDLDALPVVEQTGLPYASSVRATTRDGVESGVMHACGHDVHMTSVTGAARRLAALKDAWSGTIVLVGQPAEEIGFGAKAMLDDGLYERFPKPDFNLALHTAPQLPAGKVAYTAGWALANVDSVDITVRGVGGHGAYPHATKDPIVIAAHIVTALQTLVSRETSPLDSAVVTVGAFHAGAKHNIISDEAKLLITVRSFSDADRERLLSGIKRIAEHQARAFGAPEDRLPIVTIEEAFTPATYNDPALSERVSAAIGAAIGPENVTPVDPVMGGEDFSQYGKTEDKIPGAIFWLGAVDPTRFAEAETAGETLPSLHSPLFAPSPEPTIKTGVEALTSAALALLAGEAE